MLGVLHHCSRVYFNYSGVGHCCLRGLWLHAL
ncbi:hypothetical protein FGIG_10117 [Fasciola gigantica]|uniref:Uncharacterized protein n=1 Tax=Fasciola gigantica TaxID=46835 RepID=A0A504YIR5_FASGI|nr:hypothetical protein FGIG_10117 [Fasciola gigantica]